MLLPATLAPLGRTSGCQDSRVAGFLVLLYRRKRVMGGQSYRQQVQYSEYDM